MLRVRGFRVENLGVRVRPREFVDSVVELGAAVAIACGYVCGDHEESSEPHLVALVRLFDERQLWERCRLCLAGRCGERVYEVLRGRFPRLLVLRRFWDLLSVLLRDSATQTNGSASSRVLRRLTSVVGDVGDLRHGTLISLPVSREGRF